MEKLFGSDAIADLVLKLDSPNRENIETMQAAAKVLRELHGFRSDTVAKLIHPLIMMLNLRREDAPLTGLEHRVFAVAEELLKRAES